MKNVSKKKGKVVNKALVNAILDLIAVGSSCSNACFNLSQQDHEDKEILKQASKQWDENVLKVSKLLMNY